jgi:hypothetical protein
MRLLLGSLPTLVLLSAGLALTTPAAPARAQMNCFDHMGGRATCVESNEALFDRLTGGAADRRVAEAARQRRLARKVAQAVHNGHCTEALELALKATDPAIAANTARLCGVPDVEATAASPKS